MLPKEESWPVIEQDEIDKAAEVLASGKINYWTGQEGRLFEKEWAEKIGTKYAIALTNGTVALELALVAADIGDGDEVIVTSRTFIASASCCIARGAVPVCCDVNEDSQNISAETIKPHINEKTKAIICVHLAGWPCDMDPIMELAEEHNLIVIEDCAQSHGSYYKGKATGSIGHMSAFSYCQDKIMTTGGEGGMFCTDNEDYWRRAWEYKDHGKSYAAVYEKEHPPGFRWLHESFGTNWRLTDMQSAIGSIQTRKLDSWIEKRTENASILYDAVKDLESARVPKPSSDIKHAYYKFYIFVVPEKLKEGWDRNKIQAEIQAAGVPVMQGSCSEIYLEKAFTDAGLEPPDRFPVAQKLGETSLMFMVHPTLKTETVKAQAAKIRQVFQDALAE